MIKPIIGARLIGVVPFSMRISIIEMAHLCPPLKVGLPVAVAAGRM